MDLALYVHSLRFENECLRRTGTEFQGFFESLMEKAESSFVVVKPWGSVGDRKCDGIVEATGTYFQVYAPETLSANQTIDKIDEDFYGAKAEWPEMAEWIFVWGSVDSGLPPDVVTHLQALRTAHPNLRIFDWGREQLWEVASSKLSEQQRVELLGPVPTLEGAGQTTAVEIRTLLSWLSEQPLEPGDPSDDFDLTALGDKLRKNGLTSQAETLLGRSLPIAAEVDRYVSGNVDVNFSRKIATRLVARYERLTAEGRAPDAIFLGLVEYLAGTEPTNTEFWAGVGVVSHYFELCDLFER